MPENNLEKEKTVKPAWDYSHAEDLIDPKTEIDVLRDYIAQVDRELMEVKEGLRNLLRRPI